MAEKYFKRVKISSIREMVTMARDEAGDKIAYEYKVKDGVAKVSFTQFYNTLESLGAAIEKRGFGDSHIACVGENSYRWITVFLTVLMSAGVYVPIDKELPENDLVHLIENSESEVVFCDKKHEKAILAHKDELTKVKLFVSLDREADENGLVSYNTLIAEGEKLGKEAYDALHSDENALKLLVYTSGTTGMSKGVMLTEHNLTSAVYYDMMLTQTYGRALSVLPYNHTYEAVCDILVNIHDHYTVCINDSLPNILKNMKLFQPTNVYLVPAFAELFYQNIWRNIKKQGKEKQFNMLLKLSRGLRHVGIDLRRVFFKQVLDVFGGSMKKLICGGAPIRPEIGEFFGDIGLTMTGGYGITECSPLIAVNDDSDNDYRSAGRRVPCLCWRIDQPNEEGIGEIVVKGDVVMKGYYKQPEETAKVLKDGWFFTGDYGRISDKDRIFITGRKKNLIILSNGKNIYPEEIEAYVTRVEYIDEAVVRGIPNAHGEETGLLAEIYMKEPRPADTALADIQQQLSVLPSFKNVSKVIVREEPFPRTTTNKIKR